MLTIKKKIPLIATLFITFISIFVYPSFRFPGIDCISGCSMPKGLPLPYSFIHKGAFGISGNEFSIEFLVIDIIIWFSVAAIIARIVFYFKNKNINE